MAYRFGNSGGLSFKAVIWFSVVFIVLPLCFIFYQLVIVGT